ncbi:hypothetical protein [Microbacterium sp. bgisy207]|uniref:hypothetical protein n=1 Tax=Microbacterium sp. bgisy207 TaxID=3413800 RepID=UPI003EBB1E83
MGEGTSAPLVAAIERTWAAIQQRHSDVPEVVVTLASGRTVKGVNLGHFAPDRWVRGDEVVHELFIGGEGLSRGGVDVLGTLLHEAAHGAANTRGIKDTSRQGRYHNAAFRSIAESFGLTLEKDPRIGWSVTTVPTGTAETYAAEVAQLTAAITAYRRSESPDAEGKTKSNNGRTAVCSCSRKIRASNAVIDAGPILCGLCGTEFETEEQYRKGKTPLDLRARGV